MGATPAGYWCGCPDAPTHATGASSMLDHPSGCDFPTGVCIVRSHRVVVHRTCGREIPMLYCGCGATAFTFDRERGWWIHYVCGWPTRAWYESAGHPAPEELLGVRPLTTHEFVPVPRVPKTAKKRVDPLTPERREINEAMIGSFVRD